MTLTKELPAYRLSKEELLKFWVRDRDYRNLRGGGYFHLGRMEDAQASQPTLLTREEMEKFWVSEQYTIDDTSDPGYWNLAGICQAVLDKQLTQEKEAKAKNAAMMKTPRGPGRPRKKRAKKRT